MDFFSPPIVLVDDDFVTVAGSGVRKKHNEQRSQKKRIRTARTLLRIALVTSAILTNQIVKEENRTRLNIGKFE